MVWIVQTETSAATLNQNLKLWQGCANIASIGEKYVENRIGQSENRGAPSRPVLSREDQIWWPMFVNWLVSLCMFSLSQNPADSFAAEGGEWTYITLVFKDKKYL
jgi:hypothetical protein